MFGIEDELVTTQEIEELKRRFRVDIRTAHTIINRLIHRYDPEAAPTLNLQTLFSIFDTLSRKDFHEYVVSNFDSSMDRIGISRAPWPIEKLADNLEQVISNGVAAGKAGNVASLAHLLLYLLDIAGPNWFPPARSAVQSLAQRHRNFVFDVLEERLRSGKTQFSASWWDIAGDIVRGEEFAPPSLVDFALQQWRSIPTGAKGGDVMSQELAEFLSAADRKAHIPLPAEVSAAVHAVAIARLGRFL